MSDHARTTRRYGRRLLVGVLLGPLVLFLAFEVVALQPRELRLPDTRELHVPDARAGNGVTISFIETATANPRGYRLAQGLGLQRTPIAFRAVVIEHPRATMVFNTGLDADHRPRHLGATIDNPFGSVELGTPLAEVLPADDIGSVVLASARWYNIGGADALDETRIILHSSEMWAATTGPWPRRYGIDTDWYEDIAGQVESRRFDGQSVLGSRGSYDFFGDGSVLLLNIRGSAFAEVALLVTLDSGRQLLLVSDAVWHHQQINHNLPRYPATNYTHDVNRHRLALVQGRLHQIVERYGIEVIPTMDGTLELPEYPARWE